MYRLGRGEERPDDAVVGMTKVKKVGMGRSEVEGKFILLYQYGRRRVWAVTEEECTSNFILSE